ncbi:YggT family protein [Streptococcus sp.]|uniref:YggT family protein n=1 Tax=Streptococcus sp. TaxID=1306 RepID=UPI00025859AB|nr:YggT family protein [Streptococcus sp.]EIC81725.1 Cell division membrane protein [Streptococcus salivarius PS4]
MSILLYVIWARVVNVAEILLVVYALLSWFPGAYDTSLGKIIRQIVNPILAPFRRLNLVFAGVDFSIIVIVLLLNFSLTILRNILF